MKFITTTIILLAALLTAVAVTYIPSQPLSSLYVFLIPIGYLIVTPKLKLSETKKTLLTGLLFIFTMNVYSFGGYLNNKETKINAISVQNSPIKHITDVKTIDELKTLVNLANMNFPIKVDMLTMLTNISINSQKREYVMTLQLNDIDVDSTDIGALNNLLSDGLNSQCDNGNFKYLHSIGINVYYEYIDTNKHAIGKHLVDFSKCSQNTTQII